MSARDTRRDNGPILFILRLDMRISDLSIPIPCVAYDGVQYGFTLKFFSNLNDPLGLYWKMDMSTLVVK